MRRGNWRWHAGSVAVAAGFVALWQLAADRQVLSPIFFAGPDVAWHRLALGLAEGTLLREVLATAGRLVYGWALASLLGVAFGALIGMSAAARAYLVPTLELLQPIPASAIVPVAIGFFGLSNRMVLAVVAFGGLWPTLLATIQGVASVEPRLKDLGASLGLTRLEVMRKIALPSALPDILAALRLSATNALVLTVIGEMVASRSGVGRWILMAGRTFHAGDVFAGIIVLGALGYASASLIAWIERRLLRWRRPD